MRVGRHADRRVSPPRVFKSLKGRPDGGLRCATYWTCGKPNADAEGSRIGPAMLGESDEELMVRVAAGDAQAFRILARRSLPRALALARRMAGHAYTPEPPPPKPKRRWLSVYNEFLWTRIWPPE